MCDLRELEGAVTLTAKFDTVNDADKIDSIICVAMQKGLDINEYEDDSTLLLAEVI